MSTLRAILASLRRTFSDWEKHKRGLRDLLRALRRLLRWLFRRERRPPPRRRGDCCVDLPPDVYRRPDPLIYDQYFLMKMGLAVTWDNPDIQLFEQNASAPNFLGAPVASSALQPNHSYRVRVTVWNGSYHAPAVGLPVHLSYLSFGAGTTTTPVGTTHVDLGVKGGAHHPAFAYFDWTTPPAGHYCLQALLEWADDANPDNNLGQENVEVGAHHSPAAFALTLRNEASVRRRFVLEADAYRLPDVPGCDDPDAERWDVRNEDGERPTRLEESRARWERARREHAYGAFAVPQGWTVALEPSEVVLGAFEERRVDVTIDPQGPQPVGDTPVNVNAFVVGDSDARQLVGGVTLQVTGG